MSVSIGQYQPNTAMDQQAAAAPNWTINVSDIRTVKVGNISLAAIEQDIKEFLSFSGEIVYVEMRRESKNSQLAYVTFKESQGADTAILLSGAMIINLPVSITHVDDYQLPPSAFPPPSERKLSGADAVVRKAEEVVSSMLARDFVLGKDAINKAKAFDERHQLISNASATVESLDQKMGLSEKLGFGTAVVHEKVREVDERYQVYEKTKSALVAAEQTASMAGSAIMSNHYFSMGASWVSSALGMVAKAAEDVSTMTKEKVERAEEEKKESIYRERTSIISNYAQIHFEEEIAFDGHDTPVIPVHSAVEDGKLEII